MSRRRDRVPRREAEDVAARIKDAWVVLPAAMPMGAVVKLPGVIANVAQRALDGLQPYERATSQVRTITVIERERSDDGTIRYDIEIDREHDCPNGACDDCID